ncbi:hypothetical protein DITRI_Ditri01bG0191500 [Diplodiscus trichospermus]
MKQKIVIKVSMHCDKCQRKALKIAAAADGVVSVALHGPEKDKLMVAGDEIDAVCLTSCLKKRFSYASLETVEEVKDQKEPGNPNNPKPPGNDPKPITPYVCCCQYCIQPQLGYSVVTDPYLSPCTIL